mgnify:CR=1 FL=1
MMTVSPSNFAATSRAFAAERLFTISLGASPASVFSSPSAGQTSKSLTPTTESSSLRLGEPDANTIFISINASVIQTSCEVVRSVIAFALESSCDLNAFLCALGREHQANAPKPRTVDIVTLIGKVELL